LPPPGAFHDAGLNYPERQTPIRSTIVGILETFGLIFVLQGVSEIFYPLPQARTDIGQPGSPENNDNYRQQKKKLWQTEHLYILP
jgi:hypothetical protein